MKITKSGWSTRSLTGLMGDRRAGGFRGCPDADEAAEIRPRLRRVTRDALADPAARQS